MMRIYNIILWRIRLIKGRQSPIKKTWWRKSHPIISHCQQVFEKKISPQKQPPANQSSPWMPLDDGGCVPYPLCYMILCHTTFLVMASATLPGIIYKQLTLRAEDGQCGEKRTELKLIWTKLFCLYLNLFMFVIFVRFLAKIVFEKSLWLFD